MRLMSVISERLTDAEVHSPTALLRLAVDEQTGNGIQLIAVVEPDGPDRRLVTKPRSMAYPERVHRDGPRVAP